MIEFKQGVKLDKLQPQIILALMLLERVFLKVGQPLVVTSISDGTHGKASLHYKGLAVDLRTKHLGTFANKSEVLESAKKALNPLGFDVILESLNEPNEHLHCEYQPK